MSLLRNQIIGLSRAGASGAEIAEALGVEGEIIELALGSGKSGSLAGTARMAAEREERGEEEVSAEESKKMLKIIKNIALDDEVSV